METSDAFNQIRTDLGLLLQQGQEFVHIPAFLAYLNGLEQSALALSQAAELQHQSQLAHYRATHESDLEMFKSVLETGKTAVTTAILVSGGATVAMLAFVGNLQAKLRAEPISTPVVVALILFAAAVLSAAAGSGARYLSQACYASHWQRSAVSFHVACIVLVVASYGLFAAGVVSAYHGFIK